MFPNITIFGPVLTKMTNKSKKVKEVKEKLSSSGVGASATESKFPTPKNPRTNSDDAGIEEEKITEVDRDMLIDSMLGCLGKDERLWTRFVRHLFEVPGIHKKIIEVVEKNLKIETAHSKHTSYADPESNNLKESVMKLTDSMDKQTTYCI